MNSLEKDFIPYGLALEMKQLGFNEPCFAIYYSKNKSFSWHLHVEHKNEEPILDNGEFNVSAPTFSQCFRWFREKHTLQSHISFGLIFSFVINNKNYEDYPNYEDNWFRSYEDAEIKCLKQLIKIVKDE